MLCVVSSWSELGRPCSTPESKSKPSKEQVRAITEIIQFLWCCPLAFSGMFCEVCEFLVVRCGARAHAAAGCEIGMAFAASPPVKPCPGPGKAGREHTPWAIGKFA